MCVGVLAGGNKWGGMNSSGSEEGKETPRVKRLLSQGGRGGVGRQFIGLFDCRPIVLLS